ncbi:MAG TPA: hypothetical protein VKZ54_09030 [Membranihabitans sp.]|nr:hypothetical protein [Membranihabitans sp.]
MTNIIPSIFFDGIDRTHVRSMRNRKLPFSGGLAGIAVATVSIFDEASGHFSPQIPVKIKRAGYIVVFQNILSQIKAFRMSIAGFYD